MPVDPVEWTLGFVTLTLGSESDDPDARKSSGPIAIMLSGSSCSTEPFDDCDHRDADCRELRAPATGIEALSRHHRGRFRKRDSWPAQLTVRHSELGGPTLHPRSPCLCESGKSYAECCESVSID